jgi:hypothetical protein
MWGNVQYIKAKWGKAKQIEAELNNNRATCGNMKQSEGQSKNKRQLRGLSRILIHKMRGGGEFNYN